MRSARRCQRRSLWAIGARSSQVRSRETAAHDPRKHAWQMPFTRPDAPASKRPRAQGDAVAGQLRNPNQRCAGKVLQDGKHRATTHYLNEVTRHGAPLCTLVATYTSDLCPGFVASDVAPRTFIRHVTHSTDKFEPHKQLFLRT